MYCGVVLVEVVYCWVVEIVVGMVVLVFLVVVDF